MLYSSDILLWYNYRCFFFFSGVFRFFFQLYHIWIYIYISENPWVLYQCKILVSRFLTKRFEPNTTVWVKFEVIKTPFCFCLPAGWLSNDLKLFLSWTNRIIEETYIEIGPHADHYFWNVNSRRKSYIIIGTCLSSSTRRF